MLRRILLLFSSFLLFPLVRCRPLVVFKQIIDTYTRQHRRTQIYYIFFFLFYFYLYTRNAEQITTTTIPMMMWIRRQILYICTEAVYKIYTNTHTQRQEYTHLVTGNKIVGGSNDGGGGEESEIKRLTRAGEDEKRNKISDTHTRREKYATNLYISLLFINANTSFFFLLFNCILYF